ncbi:hypothetical protein C8N24_6374 [Solirubrobacter pauli]|uniref:Uncharacterized protein n=1 Tax=Solirubrobacter pauli TaxID=166793 RepID=A0A660L686_9ACTN|nr:hypothetical protein [Solirubrobacter pauli]RKQ88332.1 hypothetical protein C8N24_6374 [Solirubrobacter pauli]
MRWLILALTLAVGFTTFVVVAALRSGPASHSDQWRPHEPETDAERAAARVVLTYMRALIEERPADACRLVAPPLTKTLRCGTRPRIPHRLHVYARGTPSIEHIALEGREGHAWVAGIDPGPLQGVAFARVGDTWRLIADGGGFALQ